MRALLPLAAILLLAGCAGQSGSWGWYVIDPSTPAGQTNIRFLVGGFWTTIEISLLAAALSMAVGLLVALPGMSANRLVRLPSRVYVEFIRAIPILPFIFWVYYGLPFILKAMGLQIQLDVFWAAVITLALSDSAFTAEIYRAGIQSIPRGQTEAAQTVGLNYWQTMRYVVLPQALRRILPPLANQFIYIVKMSAFASVIGLSELTRRANDGPLLPIAILSYLRSKDSPCMTFSVSFPVSTSTQISFESDPSVAGDRNTDCARKSRPSVRLRRHGAILFHIGIARSAVPASVIRQSSPQHSRFFSIHRPGAKFVDCVRTVRDI